MRLTVMSIIAFVAVLACLDLRAAPVEPLAPGQAEAVFAGGCFWCMESDFEHLDGVLSVTSGYAGGKEENPSYEQVSSGTTGHAESVRVVYDPKKVTYEKLVDYFLHHVDPTQKDGQFCDWGKQYRTVIFFANDAEKKVAVDAIAAVEKSGILKAPVVTQVVPLTRFWPAEGYHQDYYKKNPGVYARYRTGCGRDGRVQELWQPRSGGGH
jgi:peptide-methionine (S)-S-oxide reductase